jgi:hypothetical protein
MGSPSSAATEARTPPSGITSPQAFSPPSRFSTIIVSPGETPVTSAMCTFASSLRSGTIVDTAITPVSSMSMPMPSSSSLRAVIAKR